MKKINIISLGCYKNLVDSEFLATYLQKNNIEVAFEAPPSKDQTVIINTCGFIHDAKEESIEYILEYSNLKQKGEIKDLYVIGCLSERYRKELKKEIPEIKNFYGVHELPQIVKKISNKEIQPLNQARYISTPSHYAYLKIAEGCNKNCAFCSIPAIRGKHISVNQEEIIFQAQKLVDNGVKELLVISQDTSFYGKDKYNKFKLPELLTNLVKIDKLDWLRLHYLYPNNLAFEIIDIIKNYPKICNYLDIPFQHSSDKILKLMQRSHNEAINRKIIEYYKKNIPDGGLRTSIIVGFPNETDEDFNHLYNFVKEVEFDKLGIFSYSHEEGTPAYKLEDNVPNEVKNERIMQLEELQANISYKKNQKKIGRTYKVLIDRIENDFAYGRTEYDSPEVDTEVKIEFDQKIKVGNFYNIKIQDADEFDLFGKAE